MKSIVSIVAAAAASILFSVCAAVAQEPGMAMRSVREIQRIQAANDREWNRMMDAQFEAAQEQYLFNAEMARQRYAANPSFETELAFLRACRPMVLSPDFQRTWEKYFADMKQVYAKWNRRYDGTEERDAMARLEQMRADAEKARKASEQRRKERDAEWNRFKQNMMRNFGKSTFRH